MIVNNLNAKDLKVSLVSEKTCQFENTITQQNLQDAVNQILAYEEQNADANIKIQLKDFSADQTSSFLSYILDMEDFEKMRNVSIVLNLFNLLKTYNTFDDSFFQSEDIFVNSIDQMLDVKSDLSSRLVALAQKILETFISMCRTLPKTEYSVLDQYEDVPNFYKVFFCSVNMLNLCEIFSIVPATANLTFRRYKFTAPYIQQICSVYAASNRIIDQIISSQFLQKVSESK